jgi:hypothetical protein
LKAAPEHMHSLLLSMTEIMFKPRADANVVSFEESEQRLERELAARA